MVLLHGPVNAFTDIPRRLRRGEMIGGALAACQKVGTGRGHDVLSHTHPKTRMLVDSALTYS